MIEIPLLAGVDNARQRLYIQLGDNFTELQIKYVTLKKYFVMDVIVEGVLKMSSVALMPACEISATYNDPSMGRFYFIGRQPTIDNLGVDNKLLWSAS